MSAQQSRTFWSEAEHTAVKFATPEQEDEAREIVRMHVRLYGFKRGLALAALHAGTTERRAKALYTGEPLRLTKAEYEAALDARMTLRRRRAAECRREADEHERMMDVEMAASFVGVRR